MSFGLLSRSLQARQVASFMAIVAVLASVGGVNYVQSQRLESRAKAMAMRDVIPMSDLRAAEENHLQGVIMSMVMQDVYDPQGVEVIKTLGAQADAALTRLQTSIPAEFKPQVDKLVADRKAFLAAHEARMKASMAGDTASVAAYHKQAGDLAQVITQEFQQLADQIDADAQAQQQTIESASARQRQITGAAVGGGLVLAILLGWALTRSVRRPLNSLMFSLGRLAEGDLTYDIPVTSQDEIGRVAAALGRATRELRKIVSGVAQSASALSGASTALTGTNHRISQASQATSGRADEVSTTAAEVATNVDALSAAAVELSTSIREIADNTGRAAVVGDEAAAAARAGNTIVAKLGESSAEIGSVLKVITSIAEQTNLLALNATIEAARAGEMGKGFAVVAGEVKELAQETAKATSDIGARIDAIQADSAEAVEVISRIGEIVNRINNYQTAIASAVAQQTETSEEMGRRAADAASGSTAIASAITDVAEAAGQAMIGTTETETAAAELASLSRQLQDLVSTFRY